MSQLEMFTDPTAAAPDFTGRLYSCGTWDIDRQSYWPVRIDCERLEIPCGLLVRGRPSINLTLQELRAVMRELRGLPKRNGNHESYPSKVAWRYRVVAVGFNWSPSLPWVDRIETVSYESDWRVLVERTDGLPLREILERWKR